MIGLIRVSVIAALLLGARPVQAQVLWRLDTSAAAAPLAGATELKGTEEEGRVVDRSRVDGAGPNGEAVYRFQFRHDASQMNSGAAWGGEHYLGWFRDVGPVPQTPSVFTRVLFRVMPGSTFRRTTRVRVRPRRPSTRSYRRGHASNADHHQPARVGE